MDYFRVRPSFNSHWKIWSTFEELKDVYMVISHETDTLLKLNISNPNGCFTCYSMYFNGNLSKL